MVRLHCDHLNGLRLDRGAEKTTPAKIAEGELRMRRGRVGRRPTGAAIIEFFFVPCGIRLENLTGVPTVANRTRW